MTTPEEAIEDGIWNRLNHGTNGIVVAAGEYCADNGGIQVYSGQVDLTVESVAQWAFAGPVEGPLVLIVAGANIDYETDKARFTAGTYAIQIFICAGNWRTRHEADVGDAGDDSRGPGLYQVKSDILDRLLNHVIVTEASPAWVERYQRLATRGALVLGAITMAIDVAELHQLTAWGDLDDLSRIRSTMTKEPSSPGTADDLIVEIDNTYP